MATQGIAQNQLLTLVLGGARSGKSRHAQSLARATPAPWVMIATAEAHDEEMRARIDEHRRERGDGWITVEAPIDLAGALARRPCRRAGGDRLPDAVALQSDARRPRRRSGRLRPRGSAAGANRTDHRGRRTRSGSASCRRRRSAAPFVIKLASSISASPRVPDMSCSWWRACP